MDHEIDIDVMKEKMGKHYLDQDLYIEGMDLVWDVEVYV